MNPAPISAPKTILTGELKAKPQVSVIIIFLDAEQFLQDAIESVLNQTYDNWELLLVDDGSTDQSSAIAHNFSKRYPENILYLEHPGHQNLGKPISRNLGIERASGKYIAFLDADDVWLPYKLEQQVAILETHPEVALVYGRTEYWYSWTGQPEDRQRDTIIELGAPVDSVIQPPAMLSPFFIGQQYALPGPSNFMVRKKATDEVGGFDESFIHTNNVYEDQAFIAKLSLKAPIFASNACWDRYRQHSGSSCAIAERAGQDHETREFFLNWLVEYLEGQGFDKPEIIRSLEREIWWNQHPSFKQMVLRLKQIAKRIELFPFKLAYRLLPSPIFEWLRANWRGQKYLPPVGWVRLGSLRRLTPLSREFGYDRGRPIDRYYIEKFLSDNQADIRGNVLEIADDHYTRKFGGEKVYKSDVLHVLPGDPKATIIGDLSSADHIPSNSFDCIILTQTLQVIYDVRAVIQTVYRILKPGGVILATVPGIGPISSYDMQRWGYYWGFTSLSARRLFEEVFPQEHVQVKAYGNVLTAATFLYGMATEELMEKELEHFDPDYEVIIAVKARKPKYQPP